MLRVRVQKQKLGILNKIFRGMLGHNYSSIAILVTKEEEEEEEQQEQQQQQQQQQQKEKKKVTSRVLLLELKIVNIGRWVVKSM